MRHRLIRRLEVPRPRCLEPVQSGYQVAVSRAASPVRGVASLMAVRALGVGSPAGRGCQSSPRPRQSRTAKWVKGLVLDGRGSGENIFPRGRQVAGLHADDFHIHLFAIIHTIRRGTPVLPDEPYFCRRRNKIGSKKIIIETIAITKITTKPSPRLADGAPSGGR